MPETSPRRAPRPDQRQRDPERTKARILEAAKAEFGEKGFAAARVSGIADRAGVNKQLISYYFGGKEGLYSELTSAMQQTYRTVADPSRKLSDVAADFAQPGQHDHHLARLFLWENITDDGKEGVGAESQRKFLQHQLDYMRARQEAGDFPADLDPAMLMLILMAAGSVSFAFPRLARVLTGLDPTSAEFGDAYAEQLVRMVEQLKA